MKVNFTYNKEKDVWCLLNKGKSSNNSQNSTKQYKLLVEKYGENPTPEDASVFIDAYILKNKINIPEHIEHFQKDWEHISSEFRNKAEAIFDTSLAHNITACLSINSRCPYNILENFFYVSLQSTQAIETVMHELWHFYTWYGIGAEQEQKLGKEKYNDLKESLTVLLNIECKNLLPQDVVDTGYPQHQELRAKILEYWEKDKNIKNLWNYISV